MFIKCTILTHDHDFIERERVKKEIKVNANNAK